MHDRPIRIDMRALELAFESGSDDVEHYLDAETGEVVMVMEGFQDFDPEEVVQDKERYIEIPKQSPHEGYRDMVDFITTVRDGNLREKLEVAIDGRGAFRRFKQLLSRYPDVQNGWYAFKEKRLQERIAMWLEEHTITPI